jgi:hypothetical protein
MPDLTNEQLSLYTAYASMRNAPRLTMAHGVYPNSVKALDDYAALEAWLADHPDMADSHAAMIAAVAPHIATLQESMQTIIDTMQMIEQAAPGTFGIAIQ